MFCTAIINDEIFENCFIVKDPNRLCLPVGRNIKIGSFSRNELYQSWVKCGFFEIEKIRITVKDENGHVIEDYSRE